jgi:hypothetical protein
MKKLYFLTILAITTIALIYSCSTEEEDTTPPPSVVATPEPEPETPAPTQYTLTVTAGEGGSVSSEGGTYDEGTELTITATADEGYEFVGWEGSDSNESSLSLSLDQDISVTALFTFVSRSERFSEINETTGYFASQKHFSNYLSKDFINNNLSVFPSSGHIQGYATFHKNSAVLDIDGDYKADIIAFANSTCPDHEYGFHPGKLILIRDYLGNAFKSEYDISNHFGSGKFEVNDFTGDGVSDIIFMATETKANFYDEQEDYGSFSNNFPPQIPKLIYFDGDIRIEEVGVVADNHTGTSGDVDNDGDIDFIQFTFVTLWDDYLLAPKLIRNVNGNFLEEDLITDLNGRRWDSTAIELFDVNGDGFLDLLSGWKAGIVNDLYRGEDDITDSFGGPVLLFGDGSGKFSLSNSIVLDDSILDTKDYQVTLLGYGFTDKDEDGDIDILISTTRTEPGGSFENGTYYDNYHLVFLENNEDSFIDTTNSLTDFFSADIPNFYLIKTIDIDNDGDIDIVPDCFANWGGQVYSDNMHWSNENYSYQRVN